MSENSDNIIAFVLYSVKTGDIFSIKTDAAGGVSPKGFVWGDFSICEKVLKNPSKYRVSRGGIELKTVSGLLA